jgi:hypothetical protein
LRLLGTTCVAIAFVFVLALAGLSVSTGWTLFAERLDRHKITPLASLYLDLSRTTSGNVIRGAVNGEKTVGSVEVVTTWSSITRSRYGRAVRTPTGMKDKGFSD